MSPRTRLLSENHIKSFVTEKNEVECVSSQGTEHPLGRRCFYLHRSAAMTVIALTQYCYSTDLGNGGGGSVVGCVGVILLPYKKASGKLGIRLFEAVLV